MTTVHRKDVDYSALSPYTEILGQPDKEYFGFIKRDDFRRALNRSLGYIWDYSPSLWDEYTSIDEWFEKVSEEVQKDPELLRAITKRASKIRERLCK